MKSPINIVFLTPGFAADEKDTAAIPSLQIYFRHLQASHPEIRFRIIAFRYPFRSGDYEWNGIPVFSAGGKRFIVSRFLAWTRILIRLKKLHRNKQANLIHCFWLSETTLIGLIFRFFTGIPVMATAMGQDIKPGNRYLYLLRHIPLDIVLISRFQSQFLTIPGKIKILDVLPFGIDPPDPNENHSARETDVLGVGNINITKDYPCFIRVIKSVTREFPAIRCRIVGDGPESKRITAMIAENGLEKNITLCGGLPYELARHEMMSARILLHTSSFEGQGLVVPEALASGMYVVSKPVGIAAEPVSEKLKTGFTEDELANHVIKLLQLNNPDYRPVITLTINRTADEYISIYRKFGKGENR